MRIADVLRNKGAEVATIAPDATVAELLGSSDSQQSANQPPQTPPGSATQVSESTATVASEGADPDAQYARVVSVMAVTGPDVAVVFLANPQQTEPAS